jgi:hypothetical protein
VRLHLIVAALHAWCIKWLRLHHVLQTHRECFQVRLAGQCRKIGHNVISITPSGFQFRQDECLAVLFISSRIKSGEGSEVSDCEPDGYAVRNFSSFNKLQCASILG